MAISLPTILIPRPKRVAQAISAIIAPAAVDVEAVRTIMDQYDLRLTGKPKRVMAGRRSRNVIVPTDAGRKVLRQYRSGWPLATIASEHSILARLAELDFPAPRLVPTAAGQTWVAADQNYALFDYIDGTSMVGRHLSNARRNKLRFTAGQLLGQLHRALDGFLPKGEHHLGFHAYDQARRRDLAWYDETITKLKTKSAALTAEPQSDDARWLIQHADELQERISDLRRRLQDVELPRTVIHGDFGLHNTLFHADGSATLLDFELARLEWRLSDLVMYIGRVGPQNCQHFLTAYESVYPLTKEEWCYLPEVWQLRNLEGAIQNWNTYFTQGIEHNLAAARSRIARADYAVTHEASLRRLSTLSATAPARQTPRVFMVVRLFYPWIGGTERQAHKLARKLQQRNVPVEIVTGWWFRGTPRRETLDGVPVFRNFTLWHFFDIKGLRKFSGYLYILTLIFYLWRRRHDYDVIHVHGLNYHTFAANLAGRLAGRPTIAKLANSGQASDILKMREDRQLALARYMLPMALKCDRFVAINQTIVDELVAAGVAPERIVSFGNGVETADIRPRADYRLGDPPTLVYVGRLHPQKGLDVLLQAMRALADEGQAARLRLVGDGPARDDLQALSGRLGLEQQVTFVGQSDQVMLELATADVFVLPSRAEGLSNALLEAMAAGLPAVVSNIPGNVDVIEHQRNGLLFMVEDARALADCLAQLLDQEELRARLGQAARQTVEDRFSLDAVSQLYVKLYAQLGRLTE